MNKELRFGFSESDISRLKEQLEALFRHIFEERESSYYGGRYFKFESSALGQFVLQKNFDSEENEWIEDSHQDLPLLLDINDAPDPEKFIKALASVEGCRLIVERER
jgi:hypothetical protein